MRGPRCGISRLPHTKYALPAYYVIAPAEASSNLARYDGVRYGHRAKLAQGDGITEMYEKTRAEGFGPEVQRRMMVGTYVLSAGFYDAYYNRARKVRALIKRDFEMVFAEGVDAILTPATPSAAFGLGEMADADPVQMYLNDVFTVTVNLAGLPGIAVPVGLDGQGLPLGLQLIGRPWDEAQLLNYAHVLESRAGFVAKAGEMVVMGPENHAVEALMSRFTYWSAAAAALCGACCWRPARRRSRRHRGRGRVPGLQQLYPRRAAGTGADRAGGRCRPSGARLTRPPPLLRSTGPRAWPLWRPRLPTPPRRRCRR